MTDTDLLYGYCIFQEGGTTEAGSKWKDLFWNDSKSKFVRGFTNATFYETREEAQGQMEYHSLEKFCRIIGE